MAAGEQPYDVIGKGYADWRQPDPRIAAMIRDALGDANSVVNVGAGTGSYEPRDRAVIAVEPSEVMIRQRSNNNALVVCASAMDLPLRDNSVAAAMAILTLHHWPDRSRGLAEMKRVTEGRCVILTWVPPPTAFWLTADYLPHFLEADRLLFPRWFDDDPDVVDVQPVQVPHDCTDGFLCAYWCRPQAYLIPEIRGAISTFSRVGGFTPGLVRLASDLEDGTWAERYGRLLTEDSLDLGYRLVILEKT
jgi:SAM-dependent methyltransferase